MTINEIEVLIECKRLVEKMLSEKRYILERLEESGKSDGAKVAVAQIVRMERALRGLPPIEFYDKMGSETKYY